jgi:CRP-like cAMP-binding protein
MNSDHFFRKIGAYADLSEGSKKSWQKLLREESYKKGRYFIEPGQIPKKVGFVTVGLLSQNYISESGDTTIKYFFPEGRFAASVGAMLTGTPSAFSVIALEDTKVLAYNFFDFKELTKRHTDIASFYIHYMEHHWIVEKEPLEISLRYDAALKRYNDFVNAYPGLVKRLKKHQIASYLGITATQLSRLLSPANKKRSLPQHL